MVYSLKGIPLPRFWLWQAAEAHEGAPNGVKGSFSAALIGEVIKQINIAPMVIRANFLSALAFKNEIIGSLHTVKGTTIRIFKIPHDLTFVAFIFLDLQIQGRFDRNKRNNRNSMGKPFSG